MRGDWSKAISSKYKHYYIGTEAACGSNARKRPFWDFHADVSPAELCPKCKRIFEREMLDNRAKGEKCLSQGQ